MKNQETAYFMEKITPCADIKNVVEILKNQLYFVVVNSYRLKTLKNTRDTHYFQTDDEYVYQNYYKDFGPLNISCLYKYSCNLNKCLQCCKGLKRVVHYTSCDVEKKTNAAYLIGAYCVIFHGFSPRDIIKVLSTAKPFKSFVDASQCPSEFGLKLLDIFQSVAKAIRYNFFNFQDFNDLEYDIYNKVQFGDMNWLLPRKFLALIGPNEGGEIAGHPPDFYVKYFLKNDVTTVIRLNNKTYNANVFTQAGIQHYDLIFPDGTIPPKHILLKFLEIAENSPMAIAVHCKAGLGRTGSLIGAYIIKHFQFTAREAIAWLRICRPGSVIGQQQMWLQKIEPLLWGLGQQDRLRRFNDVNRIECFKYGIYSKLWALERNGVIGNLKQPRQASQTSQYKAEQKGSKIMKSHSFDKKPKCTKCDGFQSISKFLSSVHGLEDTSDVKYMHSAKGKCPREKCSKYTNTDFHSDRIVKIKKLKNAIQEPDYASVNPLSQKMCFHKGVQGDTSGRKITDNHQTCIEIYNKRKNLNRIKFHSTHKNAVSEQSRGEHSKQYIPDSNNIPMKQFGTQGDRLVYIKANKMN